ncbi:cytochrome P450 2B1-like [Clavelina lepadiformis]|uniref:cytochrome P450 2B1-like n=1 Tax=Clavelina lepadiformis TaxID=159417 RepID=UPI004042C818
MNSSPVFLLYSTLCSIFNVWTILALAIVSFYQWWKKPHPNFPPGPRGVPILGVLPWLGGNPQKVFFDWGQKYGPVLSVRMAGVDTVFLNTYDAINAAFVKQGDNFSGKTTMELFNDVLGNNGVVFVDFDDKMRNQRKFAMQTLKKLGMGKQKMENIVNEEVCHFANYLKSKLGKPVDLQSDYDNMIGNVICVMTFGHRYDYDDPKFKRIFELLTKLFTEDENLLILLMYFYKYLRYIPPFRGVHQSYAKRENTIADVIKPIIEEHKRNFQADCISDYIDAFLYEQKYGKEKDFFTDDQLCVSLRDIFVAGTETTSLTLGWLFLGLLNYPDYHRKVMAEVDKVLGNGTVPSMAYRPDMPVTCAFIQEVMRYCTIIPNALTHKTTQDTTLYGFTLPKGTAVTPNIYAAGFDPVIWPSPHTFSPDRHIDERGKFVYSPKVIPFGMGGRGCIGESLARTEIFLIFVGILQRFTITSGCSTLPTIRNGNLGIFYGPKPYKVRLELR